MSKELWFVAKKLPLQEDRLLTLFLDAAAQAFKAPGFHYLRSRRCLCWGPLAAPQSGSSIIIGIKT